MKAPRAALTLPILLFALACVPPRLPESRQDLAPVMASAEPPELAPVVESARPAISRFLRTLACVEGHPGRTMSPFLEPGQWSNRMISAKAGMKFNKSSCVQVDRVGGWRAEAQNALRFEAAFRSPESGEVRRLAFITVRQPDGRWLFRIP